MATSRSRLRLFLGLVMAGVSALSAFAPAVAADEPVFQPDAWIARSGGRAYGMGVYNLSAVGQEIYLTLPRNVLRRVYVHVRNQGDVPTPFAVTVICCGSSSDTVRYFVGRSSREITDDVVAGTYSTPELAPGATFTMRVTVLTNGLADPGSFYARKFIFSALGGGVPDAVRMWVRRL